ncbi:hypothetical protein Patl1_15164 [Pistacia atlantica]|uniref:Uncharacterized protein n=1 Tax=Pistacia atlantica TaxID=434234 RepID=A0ACC1BAR8_9ROSI|nr:hypothetical protein Patl1_15164 [Pistacia atlantica]
MHYKDSVHSVSPNPVKTKSTPGMLTWKFYYPEYQYQVCSLNAGTPIYWPYELGCLDPDGTCWVGAGTTACGHESKISRSFAEYEAYFMDRYVNMGFLLGQLLLGIIPRLQSIPLCIAPTMIKYLN